MKEKYQQLADSLNRALGLPDDITRGNCLISIHGREHIRIENLKGISSYTEEKIRVMTKKYAVSIRGKHLRIVSYTKEEMEICGIIQKIEYM